MPGAVRSVGPRPWREAPIDRDRLIRAIGMAVEMPEPGIYRVRSETAASETYWVNMRDEDVPLCDCGDTTFRDTLCKHALACLLYHDDPRAWHAVMRVIQRAFHSGGLGLTIL
jgi:hypothetical protein